MDCMGATGGQNGDDSQFMPVPSISLSDAIGTGVNLGHVGIRMGEWITWVAGGGMHVSSTILWSQEGNWSTSAMVEGQLGLCGGLCCGSAGLLLLVAHKKLVEGVAGLAKGVS
jgi:hypothetical protein